MVDQPAPPVGPVGPGALARPRPRRGRDADGPFVYTPKRSFRGTDHPVYEASDGIGGTATDTETIKVGGRG